MDILLYIIKGLILGLMVSIPLGPVGVIVIQRTLNKGWASGFISGMGASVADLLYAIFAATGFSLIVNLMTTQEFYLKIVTFIIITIIGLVLANKSVRKLKKDQKASPNFITDFLSTFFLTFSNPFAFGVFLALFAGLADSEDTLNTVLLMLVGILLGSVLWWMILTITVNVFRKSFRFRNLYWINHITGIIIFLFGLGGLIYILYEEFFSLN